MRRPPSHLGDPVGVDRIRPVNLHEQPRREKAKDFGQGPNVPEASSAPRAHLGLVTHGPKQEHFLRLDRNASYVIQVQQDSRGSGHGTTIMPRHVLIGNEVSENELELSSEGMTWQPLLHRMRVSPPVRVLNHRV